MKFDYDYFEGKCIDIKTYEVEKKKYGLSESITLYRNGYPESKHEMTRMGNKVFYQVADLGMGRAKTTTFQFTSEGEALAWMLCKMKEEKDYVERDEHLQIM